MSNPLSGGAPAGNAAKALGYQAIQVAKSMMRLLALDAPAPNRLDPCLKAALVIQNDRAEWSALMGERRCYGIGAPATHVNRNVIHFFNPAQPDGAQPQYLMTVERIRAHVLQANVGCFLFRYDGVTSANRVAALAGSRDFRVPPGQCIAQIWTDDVVFANIPAVPFAPVLIAELRGTAFDPTNNAYAYDYDSEIMLPPGTGFFIAPGLSGDTCRASAAWRERQMSPQELAPIVNQG